MRKSVQNMQSSLCYNATDYAIMKLCYYFFFKINSHYRIVISFDKQVKQDMLEFLFGVRRNRTLNLDLKISLITLSVNYKNVDTSTT